MAETGILSDIYGFVFTSADILYDGRPDGLRPDGKYAPLYVGPCSCFLFIGYIYREYSKRYMVSAGHGYGNYSGSMGDFQICFKSYSYVCADFSGESVIKGGFSLKMCRSDKNRGRMVHKNSSRRDPWFEFYTKLGDAGL